MTKKEFANLVKKANQVSFPDVEQKLAAAAAWFQAAPSFIDEELALFIIRWQGLQLDGSWDWEALDELFHGDFRRVQLI